MKQWLLFPLLSLLLLPLACGGRVEPTEIRIGLIAELTGTTSAVGVSCRNAAVMAVREVNDTGGLTVGDRKFKVRLLVEDNAGKADASAEAARKLAAGENVLAIVGPNLSRLAIPASDVAESLKTVFVTPASTTPRTTLDAETGGPKKYAFRACFIDPFQGQVLAKFALDSLKAEKAAVLYDETSDYNRGIARVFRDVFTKRGGRIVAFEPYKTGDKDINTQLTRIRDAAPDLLFLPNDYTEVPRQVRQARELGIKATLLGSDAWGSEELLKTCGGDCEGGFFSTHFAPDAATPAAKAFVESYRRQYGSQPDDVAALTYDSFGLLWKSIRSAGKLEREAVRNALARMQQYEGVTGTMQFREGSGDPVKSAVILTVRDGRFAWFASANP